MERDANSDHPGAAPDEESKGRSRTMVSSRITKIEARHRSSIELHLSDGTIIELVPVQTSGDTRDLDIQQTALVVLQDLLRRARRDGAGEP